jgi:chaperonin cofactor prefoldin
MDAQTAAPDSRILISQSTKEFFLSVCRMHKENNFNRFESYKVHNKVDDFISKDKAQNNYEQKIIRVVGKDHTEEINNISGKIEELANMNSRLMTQINSLVGENSLLKGRMHKFENVPVVKLVSKKEGREPLIITQKEYTHLKELKDKIEFLERKYDTLSKEEDYDEKLLMNHKERIEILKEKLRIAATGGRENNFQENISRQ